MKTTPNSRDDVADGYIKHPQQATKRARIPEVRCSTAELARAKANAARAKKTVSEYVRDRCCK